MTFSHKRKTITFIVRVWTEYLNELPLQWRGVVESVESREKFHFTDLTKLTEIIQQDAQQSIKKENKI